jgi:hypothetical protein
MAQVPNPVCSNEAGAPNLKSVHIPNVSLGIGTGDYHADNAVNWRAGISPGPTAPRNLVVYGTTYQRGIEPIVANSEPRIWWIDNGSATNQADYETKAIEVISRLPERAANNYALFSTYSEAIGFMRATGYSIINCDYPDITLGEEVGLETILNLEAGFAPSYDKLGTLYNLANPTNSTGFGTSSFAAPHASHTVTDVDYYATDLYKGLGTDSGISLNGSQVGIQHQDGATLTTGALDNGFVVECLMDVGNNGNFTLAQVHDASSNELVVAHYNAGNGRFEIEYQLPGGGTATLQSNPFARPTGRHLFVFYVANDQATGLNSSRLIIDNGAPIPLTSGTPVKFAPGGHRIHFASRQGAGPSWTETVQKFFFARVYKAPDGTVGENSVDTLNSANYPVYQTLWNV